MKVVCGSNACVSAVRYSSWTSEASKSSMFFPAIISSDQSFLASDTIFKSEELRSSTVILESIELITSFKIS